MNVFLDLQPRRLWRRLRRRLQRQLRRRLGVAALPAFACNRSRRGHVGGSAGPATAPPSSIAVAASRSAWDTSRIHSLGCCGKRQPADRKDVRNAFCSFAHVVGLARCNQKYTSSAGAAQKWCVARVLTAHAASRATMTGSLGIVAQLAAQRRGVWQKNM
jgi:hypothetical protein